MAPIIYLVRHAEAEHNISKDFTIRDPPLTTAGKAQASTLAATLPEPASIDVVITSPLTRTLQTTIAGFPHLARGGETGGAQLIIDADLQERSNLPCDTGSELTHGVFMKFLAEDQSIDLPKAGWKAFGLGNREDGGAVLVAQE
ncbi:hypothetical protein VdG1_05240 [Verticillium dahliae VDG1]|nr:hypothetical protein VdG1_05240 [Verticillium dahliae VDG1]